MDDPIVAAVLDNGRGEILIEGDSLTEREVFDALRARGPVTQEIMARVAFRFRSGRTNRKWRGAPSRVAGDTAYV